MMTPENGSQTQSRLVIESLRRTDLEDAAACLYLTAHYMEVHRGEPTLIAGLRSIHRMLNRVLAGKAPSSGELEELRAIAARVPLDGAMPKYLFEGWVCGNGLV